MYALHSVILTKINHQISLQIEKIWKYQMGQLTFALTQRLPYVPFLKHAIYEITEKGQLNKLQQKWKVEEPDCAPLRRTGKPLSLKKLSSLFLFIVSGFTLAIISFLFEYMFNFFVPKHYPKTCRGNMEVRKLKIKLKELKEISAIKEGEKYPSLQPLIQEVEKLLNVIEENAIENMNILLKSE